MAAFSNHIMKGKHVFILILAMIFMLFFGHPALVSYQSNDTIFIEKKVKFKAEDVPAITIAAARQNTKQSHGWRGNSEALKDMIGVFCNTSTGFNETLNCINKQTFDLFECVENETYLNSTLTGPEFWNTELFNFYWGKVFTMQRAYLGTNWETSLKLCLNSSLAYSIWIHDKDFFIPTINKDVIPHYLLRIEQQEYIWLLIRPIIYNMMDKPDQRCEPSRSYSFTGCVKNSVSRRVGCRMEWDSWSSEEIPVCSTRMQILQFEEEFYRISETFERSEVVRYTSCLRPCHFTKYELAAEPFRSPGDVTHISMCISSTEVISQKEQKVYRFELWET